jgi:hypothetical protein
MTSILMGMGWLVVVLSCLVVAGEANRNDSL